MGLCTLHNCYARQKYRHPMSLRTLRHYFAHQKVPASDEIMHPAPLLCTSRMETVNRGSTKSATAALHAAAWIWWPNWARRTLSWCCAQWDERKHWARNRPTWSSIMFPAPLRVTNLESSWMELSAQKPVNKRCSKCVLLESCSNF